MYNSITATRCTRERERIRLLVRWLQINILYIDSKTGRGGGETLVQIISHTKKVKKKNFLI